MRRTKFTTSGAHDVIAITSPQKNDLCTEELQDIWQVTGQWTRSVYHLEKLDSVVDGVKFLQNTYKPEG